MSLKVGSLPTPPDKGPAGLQLRFSLVIPWEEPSLACQDPSPTQGNECYMKTLSLWPFGGDRKLILPVSSSKNVFTVRRELKPWFFLLENAKSLLWSWCLPFVSGNWGWGGRTEKKCGDRHAAYSEPPGRVSASWQLNDCSSKMMFVETSLMYTLGRWVCRGKP